MSVRLRIEQSCIRDGCLAPAREPGGLCSAHWRSLTAGERAALVWEAGQHTEPIDTLEVLFLLPAYGEAA